MNTGRIEKIANAVLYEGYLLYPYRSSAVKNQQRFNFGVLYPRRHCERNPGSDAWEMQTECLVRGNAATTIEVKTRFLQMIDHQGRQEGVERAALTPVCGLRSLAEEPLRQKIHFEGEPLEGTLELSAARLAENLYRVTLLVLNTVESGNDEGREEVLLHSLVSVHSILQVSSGSFISLLEPAAEFREAAEACRNLGSWPVLAGEEGQADRMLASPIILYDYPQIAPESSGDLFDGCEIDEILALRILTLTDEEKQEVRSGDERARRILERTEMLPAEHFQKLHGAMRGISREGQ
jgi:hydrogenase maturation protease